MFYSHKPFATFLEGKKKVAFMGCILHGAGVDLLGLAYACMYSDIPNSYQLVGSSS